MNSCSNFALCASAWRNWRPLAVGLVLATWSTQGFAGEKTVEIVGHRGASYDAPENTLASIRLAWQQQADAVEFDVWQSKDGQIVLLHDKDTKRTAGVEGKVDEQTYAELSRLDVGSWKSPEFAGEKIATLSEALKLTPAGKRVFIEVKCGPEVVPELKRVLMAANRPAEETAIISFSQDVCAATKRELPQCKVYWIVSPKQDPETKTWSHSAEGLIAIAKKLHADGLDLRATTLIDTPFGEKVLASGLELLVWTVNDVALARAMIAAGVQGITTDRPGWLRAELNQAAVKSTAK